MKKLFPSILVVLFLTWIPVVEAGVAPGPLIAAHRGTTTGAPENTLAAIRWASDFGADFVETDVRITADDRLVLMHDAEVNRTTNGRGRVRELTLGEIRRLDAGGGERVPTLDEAMILLSDRPQRLLLDVKADEPEMTSRLVEVVAAYGFEHRVMVGVRSIHQLEELRSLSPRVKVLAMADKPADVPEFMTYRPDGVRLWARWAQKDPALVRTVREGGAELWITSGELGPSRLRDLFPLTDGFITDNPVELRHFAERERGPVAP